MLLKDRVALVTAAGSGIGRASAKRFAAEGADVIVTDLREDAAGETAGEISAQGGSSEPIQLDVTQIDQVRETLTHLRETRGVLHVLYNHAGIAGPPLLNTPAEEVDLGIELNLKAGYQLTIEALPLLRAADGASVVFTASTAALVGSRFSPLYSMTKGGIVSLTRSLALLLAKDGIRVNSVCPGQTDTPMAAKFFDGERDPGDAALEEIVAEIPLGRIARPEEIASAALFLACEESSYITGISLPVDGGYVAR